MTTITNSVEQSVALPSARGRWGLWIALGIAQIILGSIALCIPFIASFAAVAVFGATLIISAIFQMIHSFNMRSWPHLAWYALGGLLYAIAGGFVVIYPIGGAASLALIIAALFVADGIARIAFAMANRSVDGWGWLLAAGIASLTAGMVFLIGWPATALLTTGILLGLNLISIGVSHVAVAIAGRRSDSRRFSSELQ
jgi:uncharacterized membrane protein HdeD (DUF308 family)